LDVLRAFATADVVAYPLAGARRQHDALEFCWSGQAAPPSLGGLSGRCALCACRGRQAFVTGTQSDRWDAGTAPVGPGWGPLLAWGESALRRGMGACLCFVASLLYLYPGARSRGILRLLVPAGAAVRRRG